MDTSKLNIELDMHTHTIASGHAYGTIREMAQAASERGLKLLGISEHGPGIPGTCDPIYFQNIKVVPRELYGVRVMLGAEVNILDDGGLHMGEKVMKLLDYCVAGIHNFCYTPGDVEKNTAAVVRAMSHPLVNIISHPDDGGTPLDYRRLAAAAKEYHTLLEVNSSSLRWPERRPGCVEHYREMLRWCKEYGAPIIIDSDAHDPADVRNFEDALALLETVEFPEALVINTSTADFLQYIGR